MVAKSKSVVKRVVAPKQEVAPQVEKEQPAPVQVAPRKKRQPFGVARSKLGVNKTISGQHLRWVNDEPGRVQQALDGDYSFVTPEEVGREASPDNKVKVLAGVQKNGDPMYAYLMKIPEEYYLEDKEYSVKQLDAIDDAIRGGRLDKSVGDGRYVPEGGISYKTK
jgi:hypothetical protein